MLMHGLMHPRKLNLVRIILDAAVDVAFALEYLHKYTGASVVHCVTSNQAMFSLMMKWWGMLGTLIWPNSSQTASLVLSKINLALSELEALSVMHAPLGNASTSAPPLPLIAPLRKTRQ